MLAKKPKVKSEVMFLHVKPSTKKWLKSLCKKQIGHVSQSTMLERILKAARKNPDFISAA